MRIAYVVPVPLQGAVGQRVLSVAKGMLRGQVDSVDIVAPLNSRPLLTDDGINLVRTAFAGSSSERVTAKVRRRVRRVDEALSALDELIERPDVVVVYGGGGVFMFKMIRWARRHGIRVVADVVEWYDSSHLPMGRLGPYAWDNYLMMTRALRKVDGAIVISSHLERHMRSLGVPHLVRVPPLMDVHAPTAPKGSSGRLRLAYCGSPGKKDRLDIVIRALAEVDPAGNSVRMVVAGIDSDAIKDLYGLAELPSSLIALGRVSHECALEILASADAMPLVRVDKRFSRAGFPTKVVEALALGVVPLVNVTSDLGSYLQDGLNSVLVDGPEVEYFAASLRRLMAMSRDEIDLLSKRARATAEQFAVDRRVRDLETWLTRVCEDEER